MALLYVSGALMILIVNIAEIPAGFKLIVTQAFSGEALVGGGAGSILLTVMWGIRRGLFSNEAGQGSAPIAHATAKTKEPVREGLVASLGPFIDTLVICTMTGLVIVTTGAYKNKVEQTLDLGALQAVVGSSATDDDLRSRGALEGAPGGLEVVGGRLSDNTLVYLDAVVDNARFSVDGNAWSGSLDVADNGGLSVGSGPAPEITGEALQNGAPLTALAFQIALGRFGSLIVTLAVILFAVSTGISWSYYGDRSVEYLFGAGAIPIYRWVFIFFFFLGSILPLKAVWTYGDVALGLMTLPNLIAILALTGGVVKLTKDYLSREQVPYK